MAQLRFKCPHCEAALSTTNLALAGKAIRCPKCNGRVPIPAQDTAPIEDVEPEEVDAPRPARKRPEDEEERITTRRTPAAAKSSAVDEDEGEEPEHTDEE